jgi:hypothetical protein
MNDADLIARFMPKSYYEGRERVIQQAYLDAARAACEGATPSRGLSVCLTELETSMLWALSL